MSDKGDKIILPPPASDGATFDWFLPAIHCEGNVHQSLKSVAQQLQVKQDFVTALNRSLCHSPQAEQDRVTHLSKNVKELENTLRFRLGILPPDRHASWFREAPRRDFGPFKSSVLLAPVFATYRSEQVSLIKKSIYECWSSPTLKSIPFDRPRECLWTILLQYRRDWEEIRQCHVKPNIYMLDELPDGLPIELESRALRAFLINVRSELKAIQARLNLCFDQLWSACEKMWASQEKQLAETKRRTSSSSSTHQGASRTHVRLGVGDAQALKFLGFDKFPEKDALRNRYLELAKRLHPDRAGGDEESFKQLTRAYNRLLSLVQSSS